MSENDSTPPLLLDLFRQEVGIHVQSLTAGLLALERAPSSAEYLEQCMRAAHSLKGAMRIIGLATGVEVTHAMEECFSLAQRGQHVLKAAQIDLLLRGADLSHRIANPPGQDITWDDRDGKSEIDAFLRLLSDSLGEAGLSLMPLQSGKSSSASPGLETPAGAFQASSSRTALRDPGHALLAHAAPLPAAPDRSIRVAADALNRLLGLSGESLVAARRFRPFAQSMQQLKRLQHGAMRSLESAHEELEGSSPGNHAQERVAEARRLLAKCQRMLSDQLAEMEMFDRHSVNLSQRLYDEAVACRMRPFADITGGYTRMVRDLGRTLGKQVRLDIVGEDTQVDRDILEVLDAPLSHLLCNAVDHGIEASEHRRCAGKATDGVISLEARHAAGMLQITVSDDGAGIDLDLLRATIIRRHLGSPETVAQMSEPELLDFLLLPNFTTREAVTDVSGRGVGLDVVASVVKQVRGTVRIFSTRGQGTRFRLHLPVTRSVLRCLLVQIGGEAYAFPLAYVNRVLELDRDRIHVLEGQPHVELEGRRIGLVTARQILQCGDAAQPGATVPMVVVGDQENRVAMVVDKVLGESMLVVQPLDWRLGKIKDIAAGALMEDGSPVLIIDVADMMVSVEKLVGSGRLENVSDHARSENAIRHKRVLVVEDSLTVRELERKLLANQGYAVSVAVDGMDGWNAVRTDRFDLVVTDIDMPRMDGIELITLIRKDPNLAQTPVMVVSYKDREEDRWRGLDAGADYYLTKGSFDDGTLLQAVADLIGKAQA